MKSKLALLAVAAFALTGCGGTPDDGTAGSSPTANATPQSPTGRPTPGPEATPTPGVTPSAPITAPGSGTPKPMPKPTPKPPKPVPTAADGTNYKACADARCEVAVRTGTRLPVKKSALGFTNILVISRVSDGTVDYGAAGGCCSISTKAQRPGGSYRMNNLKVVTVAVVGKTAILRLSPA
ncbi:hypothetical protein [Kribbella sp. CA-294648]|uniref:hypothetical protein n=1 Tax=Kribbella sp. CA-294648 TaxID=3239948 RepID=UPI003D8DCBC5